MNPLRMGSPPWPEARTVHAPSILPPLSMTEGHFINFRAAASSSALLLEWSLIHIIIF